MQFRDFGETPARTDGRDPLLVAATVIGVAAVALYVAAFWPTLVGEASNACEGQVFDRTAWPPSGSCGDAPWRQFSWAWADSVILALLGVAALLAVGGLVRRSQRT